MFLLRSKVFLGFALFLAAGFGILFVRAFRQTRELNQKIAQVEQSISRAESKNRDIAALVEYFSKPEHLEKDARLRLNLKKPGEEVLVLSARPETSATPSPASATVRSESRVSFGPVGDWLWSLFSRHETGK